MKYLVYRQPLSLDRFFIHEVSPNEASTAKLDHSFVLINLNRFQQIVSVYTFQADSEQAKVSIDHLTKKIYILPLGGRDTDNQISNAQLSCVYLSHSHLTAINQTKGEAFYYKRSAD